MFPIACYKIFTFLGPSEGPSLATGNLLCGTVEKCQILGFTCIIQHTNNVWPFQFDNEGLETRGWACSLFIQVQRIVRVWYICNILNTNFGISERCLTPSCSLSICKIWSLHMLFTLVTNHLMTKNRDKTIVHHRIYIDCVWSIPYKSWMWWQQ